MIAITLFSIFYALAVTLHVKRNTFIDGAEANGKVNDIRALAHWESMIIESKTAQEKMVYMRLAEEAKAKVISEVESSIIGNGKVGSIYVRKPNPDKKQPNHELKEAANSKVVSLADRRKAN